MSQDLVMNLSGLEQDDIKIISALFLDYVWSCVIISGSCQNLLRIISGLGQDNV
jgi:hypothetical protein